MAATPPDHTETAPHNHYPPGLRERAARLGVTELDLQRHILAEPFQYPDPPKEVQELVGELFEHIASGVWRTGKEADEDSAATTEAAEDSAWSDEPMAEITFEFADLLKSDHFESEEDEDEATPSAAERVFAIPELLEMIVLAMATGSTDEKIAVISKGDLHQQLRMLDLLRCRRVNTRFNQLVAGSRVLQGHLYLAAVDRIPSSGLLCYNPLAPRYFHMHLRHNISQFCSTPFQITGTITTFAAKRALGVGALWEEMYVSQPPAKAIEISLFGIAHVLRRKAGIKFKDLLEAVGPVIKEAENKKQDAKQVLSPEAVVLFRLTTEKRRRRRGKRHGSTD